MPLPDGSNESLAARGLEKTFKTPAGPVQALAGVDLSVPAGQVFGLIGPDAAGKTTFLRITAGLLLPDQGDILVDGVSVVNDTRRARTLIGYMPQRFGLYEDLTVGENMDLYADLHGLARDRRAERFASLHKMTGLEPFTGRLAGDLSGGMKQKLGLSCALLSSASLLLLDEPTVGVDPLSRRELWAIVYRMVEEEGLTVLLSTSYLDEAERCQRVALLHEGRVLDQGEPGEMTRAMRGRSFMVSSPQMHRRLLQKDLLGADGVLDALVVGEGVRVVMDRPGSGPGELGDGGPRLVVKETEPRFEDGFVARLKEENRAEGGGGPEVSGNGEAAGRSFISQGEEEGEPVIEVKDLKRAFGDFLAVKGISFTVLRGQVFGLLGANGAGKSTTFRMLCGLLKPTGGTLRVAGQDLRRARAQARAKIGYMAQKFSLYTDLSVVENLRFFSSAYGLAGREQAERLEWALEEFELKRQAGAKSGDLPLGYKQRLAMAAALMHRPEILFLDEATSGVDPLARREFWYRISDLSSRGMTVLITTHHLEEAEYCDNLVIMDRGEVLAQGSPPQIKEGRGEKGGDAPTLEEAFITLIQNRRETREKAA